MAVHGDEHEGGVATGDQDVDGAVVGHAEYAAYVWQHEEAGRTGYRGGKGKGVERRQDVEGYLGDAKRGMAHDAR